MSEDIIMDPSGVVADVDGMETPEKKQDPLRPMYMQLFSAWDVRKAPVNCIARLCTLQVTRLEVLRPLEAGLSSVLLAVSMKTPHRFLRSSEIPLGPNGTLTVPLDLTFSLQYPHFIKRGGNVLQIRLQRRKRVRNRPLGGYKNLAIGRVEMSQVLQHSFQGEVKLYAEKVPEHVAVVTISSLTTTAIDLDRGGDHMGEVSSEDEDEDMLFEYHIGSDTESGDNEQPSYESKKKFKPSTSAVLRLLRLYRSPKSRHHDQPMDPNVLMLADEEAFHGSSVAFASSPSDSEEEEEEDEETGGLMGRTPAKPTLSPFFGSDRCSLVSLPTTAKSAESWMKLEQLEVSGPTGLDSVGHSHPLEKAQEMDGKESPIMFTVGSKAVDKDWDLSRERIWCVEAGLPSSQMVGVGLAGEEEVVVEVKGVEEAIGNICSICNYVGKNWQGAHPFCVVLVGSDVLVSSSVQAFCRSSCPAQKLRFALIPIAPGLMSARLSSLDEKYRESFPADGQWMSDLQDSAEFLVKCLNSPLHSLPLPLAQVSLQKVTGDREEQSLPFMCSVSVGTWDEPDLSYLPCISPNSPPLHGATPASQVSVAGSPAVAGTEAVEFVVEYTTSKGLKEKVKVRSVLVSYMENMLNVTAIKDKKAKGILKRKTEAPGGSIISLNTSHMVCRPTGKGEGLVMGVVVDGVQIEGVGQVTLQANWDLTKNKTFSIAVHEHHVAF